MSFGDYATALECYHSPEYAKAIERKGSAVAENRRIDTTSVSLFR
ncbi:MAG: DUF1330 domain-containing protein [Pseudolabrys sp.]